MAPHKENSPIKMFLYLFDLIQGVRQFLELARKIGLITMIKCKNLRKKNLKNSAKKKWNCSSQWVSLRQTKPDETGKLSSMFHSMCHSMRLTKPHEEGYCHDKSGFV